MSTFNLLLFDLYSVNHLTVCRAKIVHQKEAIYGLFKEFKIFTKETFSFLYML